MLEKFDRYIDADILSVSELKAAMDNPLLFFAYDAGTLKDYTYAKSGLRYVRKSYGRGKLVKEVFYIISNTQLTDWQKLKAKVLYLIGW